jgi:hypothetical protein
MCISSIKAPSSTYCDVHFLIVTFIVLIYLPFNYCGQSVILFPHFMTMFKICKKI